MVRSGAFGAVLLTDGQRPKWPWLLSVPTKGPLAQAPPSRPPHPGLTAAACTPAGDLAADVKRITLLFPAPKNATHQSGIFLSFAVSVFLPPLTARSFCRVSSWPSWGPSHWLAGAGTDLLGRLLASLRSCTRCWLCHDCPSTCSPLRGA